VCVYMCVFDLRSLACFQGLATGPDACVHVNYKSLLQKSPIKEGTFCERESGPDACVHVCLCTRVFVYVRESACVCARERVCVRERKKERECVCVCT